MEIRKGPYGQFVINKIEDIGSIDEYTREIIAENIPGHMLPLYIIPTVSCYEASYDFSGLIPINNTNLDSIKEKNRLRKALGDLLLSFADLPDHLLSPSSLILDERFVFTDDTLSAISVCFDPVRIDPSKLNINSILEAGIRGFLNCASVSAVLSHDEIDGVLYAAEQNDDNLMRKEADRIRLPLPEPSKEYELLKLPELKLIILAGLISLIFTVTGLNLMAILMASAQAFILIRTVRNILHKPEITIPVAVDETRREMLFGEDNDTGGGLDAIILTRTDSTSGKEEKRAIYTDKAMLGSDRFLCDIYAPYKGISPIHAQIRKVGKIYYASDLSADNATFLDNVRLDPGTEYEIKSGQVIRCADTEYRIEMI
ncbi:MAG: FHA domain-containing protein [Clostridiales bacterium]|nr:FHA domain-containing protein [Clostridiales bacterium]